MKKLILTLALSSFLSNSFACTAVDVQAKDGSVVAGRTMEWAFDMNWQLLYYPKGTSFELSAPAKSGHAPIKLTSKYAIFGVGTALEDNAMLEGQNSAGLGLSGNFLPGFTQYQTVSKADKKYLSVLEFTQFVLSNYATVAEVKAELPKYKVWSPEIKNLPIEPTIHFLISDKSGATVVIEFINGEMRVFDTTAGVLTNSPNYDWHMINIRNYLNLSNNSTAHVQTSQGNVTQFGQGGGAIGLPGDYTPPSRFVKTAYLKRFATLPESATGAVELTVHILNNVDIPKGAITASEGAKVIPDYTQWVALKDISHNQFYFSDYNHRLTYVKIDLNQVFAESKPFAIAIDKLNYPSNDITASLTK